ncbi:MAG: aminotransferase class I/II-fold pyridoxal phosphate-dependent enzyme, partial [Candidatus Omnitrophica bacterium]|nr:aminotransferase class I/II-fold pyridoxal phosphate-dependent enzyme [Candidatus Omnitrophota bacterium]
MKIPLLNLNREYSYLKKKIDAQIRNCLSSQQWILGKQVEEFERKAANYMGTNYAVGVSSGTEALILSLSALAQKRKGKGFFDRDDEIITTPFTFLATAEAIVRVGAKPVFVDIDKDSFNIDPEKIKKAINKKTVGILPVHLYGRICQIDKICRIAKDNNLFILEDAAQSFGATYPVQGKKDKKAGSWGNLAAFSFFPSKNLGAFGD